MLLSLIAVGQQRCHLIFGHISCSKKLCPFNWIFFKSLRLQAPSAVIHTLFMVSCLTSETKRTHFNFTSFNVIEHSIWHVVTYNVLDICAKRIERISATRILFVLLMRRQNPRATFSRAGIHRAHSLFVILIIFLKSRWNLWRTMNTIVKIVWSELVRFLIQDYWRVNADSSLVIGIVRKLHCLSVPTSRTSMG